MSLVSRRYDHIFIFFYISERANWQDLMTENMIGQVVAFDEIPNDPIKFFGTPTPMLLEVPTRFTNICPQMLTKSF